MAAKKSLYQRHLDWIENHRIWGRLLIIGIYLGIAGGIIGFAEKSFDFVKWISKKDTDSIIVNIRAQNTSSNIVSFESVCEMNLVEESARGFSNYGHASVRLVPVDESLGTNNFWLKKEDVRDYFIRIPNNQENRDILDRGVGKIRLKVWGNDGQVYEAELPFIRHALAKEKALIKFSL